jgi:hypothetical protein
VRWACRRRRCHTFFTRSALGIEPADGIDRMVVGDAMMDRGERQSDHPFAGVIHDRGLAASLADARCDVAETSLGFARESPCAWPKSQGEVRASTTGSWYVIRCPFAQPISPRMTPMMIAVAASAARSEAYSVLRDSNIAVAPDVTVGNSFFPARGADPRRERTPSGYD